MLSLGLGIIALSPRVCAQANDTWIGSTSDWGTGSNWSTGLVPRTTQTAVFNGGGQSVITGVASDVATRFDAGNYTLADTDLNLAPDTYWTVASGASLTVSSAINTNPAEDEGPGGTLHLDGAGTINLNGAITGPGSFQISDGVVSLNGNSSYGGQSSVTGGTLLVNGFVTADQYIGVNNATLGGTGTLDVYTSIYSGRLAPGLIGSTGVLSATSVLYVGSGVAVDFRINGLTRGSEYDGVDMLGDGYMVFGGGKVSLDFGRLFNDGGSFDLVSGTVYIPDNTFFESVEGTGSYSGEFTNDNGRWSLTSNGQTLILDQSTLLLTISALAAVPEPSTSAALAGALAMGAVMVRRRKTAPAPAA